MRKIIAISGIFHDSFHLIIKHIILSGSSTSGTEEVTKKQEELYKNLERQVCMTI